MQHNINWTPMLNYRQTLSFLSIALLYLLFPTTNSTNDAYAYAAYIKYGHTLAEPFHILYNYLGFVIYKVLGLVFETDVLALMKVLNSIAAVLALFLLSKILKTLGGNDKQNLLLVMVCALSFGVWRFATENETYILPIVFSLMASLFYLKYLDRLSAKGIAIISFFASVACLFHVIHFFWWAGLLVGVVYKSKKLTSALFYVLSSLVVPLVYTIIVPITQNCGLSRDCLWSFFTPVLSSDNVQYAIGTDNFYFGAINFFRSFYQLHGNMVFLVKKNLVFLLPAFIGASLGSIAVIRLFRKRLIQTSRPGHFILIHFLIFGLQLLWAVYSKGNAEFMVMLPFLLIIISAHYLKPDIKFLGWLAVSLFIWNMSFGILPNHFADFNKREKLINRIINGKTGIYILEQGKEMQNQIFYRTGEEDIGWVIKLPDNKIEMDSILFDAEKKGIKVFTDCYNSQKVISRSSLTKNDISFMKSYKFEKTDSFVNFYGVSYIYQIHTHPTQSLYKFITRN